MATSAPSATRGEAAGLAGSLLLHAGVLALLSLTLLPAPDKPKPFEKAIDVSLVEDVGLVATAPQATEQPATSRAPETGPIADAPPPPAPAREPEPTPPAPQPEPAPAPKPSPAKPAPAKRQASEAAKPLPTLPRPSAAASDAAPPRDSKRAGRDPNAEAKRPAGALLGADFRKGLVASESPSRSLTPRAATIDARALADIASKIQQQIQPCANRRVKPGPGAERIRVVLQLRLNPDGSLASDPEVLDHSGVDDENQRYVARVDDLAIGAFRECQPLRGLPAELYAVPNGWRNFKMRYKLPG